MAVWLGTALNQAGGPVVISCASFMAILEQVYHQLVSQPNAIFMREAGHLLVPPKPPDSGNGNITFFVQLQIWPRLIGLLQSSQSCLEISRM
jgi:hypothetical protein